MLGGSHFFLKTISFNFLCLYVITRSVLDFSKKHSVGENRPNSQYLKKYYNLIIIKVFGSHSFENSWFSKQVCTNLIFNFFFF
jgi:hypothetical protein